MYNEDLIATLLGASIIIIFIFGIIVLSLLIVCIVAQWKLFKKAGKKGWESIIPIYNTWVLIEISGLNWWYFLISIGMSIINTAANGFGTINYIIGLYINFICYYNLAKKTKQNEILYGILGAFISFVPTLILGFSKNITFDNTIAVSPNGIIGDSKTNNNSNNQNKTPERYCLGCGQRLSNNVKFCENCGKKVEDLQTTQQ